MPWKPEDRCTTDPVTLKRIGPGAISTFFIVFFGTLLFVNVLSMLFWSKFKKGKQKLFLYFSILFNLFTFYLYWAFYSQCRPWTGWFLYVFLGFALLFILALFVTSEVIDELENTVKEQILCSPKDDTCFPQQPVVTVNPTSVWKNEKFIKNVNFRRDDMITKSIDLQTAPPEKQIEHWKTSGRVLHELTPFGTQMLLHPGMIPAEISQTMQMPLSPDTPYRFFLRGSGVHSEQLLLHVRIGRYTVFKITCPPDVSSTGFVIDVRNIHVPADALQNTVLSVSATQKNGSADSKAKMWIGIVMFGEWSDQHP